MSILSQILALVLGILGYAALVRYSRWGWWLFGAGYLGSFLVGYVVGSRAWLSGPSITATYLAATNMTMLALPVGRRHPVSCVLAWFLAAWGAIGLFVSGAYLLIPFALAGLTLSRKFAKRGSPVADELDTSGTTGARSVTTGPIICQYLFVWTSGGCHIDARIDTSRADRDNLLVGSYVLFLAQFFYCCDKRVMEPMRQYLRDNLTGFRVDHRLHADRIHEAILSNVGKLQQHAASKLFPSGPPGLGGYLQNPAAEKPVARYDFRVLETFHSQLTLSTGPNAVLLPQMLVVFYKFITESLSDPTKTQALDELVDRLLESYDSLNPRKMGTLLNARDILRTNGLVSMG